MNTKKLQFPKNGVGSILYSFLVITVMSLLAACRNTSSTSVIDEKFEGDGDNLQRVTEVMVPPPSLPKFDQVDKDDPKIVQVTFEVQEKKIEVAPGDSIWAFTYNGTIPGPMIVVHQNDFIELTLKNPSTNTQTHNIDFHAATGALGGGDISLVNPGATGNIQIQMHQTRSICLSLCPRRYYGAHPRYFRYEWRYNGFTTGRFKR